MSVKVVHVHVRAVSVSVLCRGVQVHVYVLKSSIKISMGKSHMNMNMKMNGHGRADGYRPLFMSMSESAAISVLMSMCVNVHVQKWIVPWLFQRPTFKAYLLCFTRLSRGLFCIHCRQQFNFQRILFTRKIKKQVILIVNEHISALGTQRKAVTRQLSVLINQKIAVNR